MTPLELCLPPGLVKSTTMLELAASADIPTRVYRLVEDGPGQPDLRLSACGEGDVTGRYGVLEDVSSHPDQPLDQPATVGPNGATLRVRESSVIGAGQDPLVPSDNFRVVVRVTPLATGLSWAILDPRLVLQNGLDALPSAPITADESVDVVEVVYLVPTFAAPMEAAWLITDPRSKAQVRWRVTLDPPPSRAAVLRDALEIKVVGERGITSLTGTVRIKLRNTSPTALVLKPDDLAISQGERALPITEPAPAGITLEPHKVRTLLLPLHGIDWTQEVRVRVGGTQFRLWFGRDERR